MRTWLLLYLISHLSRRKTQITKRKTNKERVVLTYNLHAHPTNNTLNSRLSVLIECFTPWQYALLIPVMAPQLEARGGEGGTLGLPPHLFPAPHPLCGFGFYFPCDPRGSLCSVTYGECIMTPGTLTTLTGAETP